MLRALLTFRGRPSGGKIFILWQHISGLHLWSRQASGPPFAYTTSAPDQMSSVDPASIVSKEEFEAKVAETYAKSKAIETPPSEKRILANLLGLTPEAVGKTTVSFPDGGDACESCGHAITFLDVAAAGLKTHSKEFMAEIITGKHGYIVNSDPHPISCYSCGASIKFCCGYTTGSYHCG
ncbi:hypothetical protein C8R45DRAFT_1221683 [Mycena sanguinolenta]|nr:hypothetical protein C8R45DRAFT_1221683 [Mycena sanguinolenta]